MRFDEETASVAAGDSRRLELSGAWNIADKPNGGYLSAIVIRAMRDVAAHPDPLSVTTHFFRPGLPGRRAEVDVEVVRSGRSTSTTRGRLRQDGKDRLSTVAVFGELAGSDVEVGPHADIDPPSIPPPEQCTGRDGGPQGVELPILDRLEVRLDPACEGTGEAELRGWVRFADGRGVDTLALPLFADAFPPSLFNKIGPTGWVPTVELTVHVRRRPVEGWVLARFVVEDLVDGRFIEDGTLWDSSGAVVARSRQLGLLLNVDAADR